jgi:L-ascorbate metabolism protein UlaG (beta-lactamase superfamily)
VEFDNAVLIFDYYKGTIPKFNPEKHLYVFASHKHQDHFDKKIFEFAKDYPNITYILSIDIRMNNSYMDSCQIPISVRERILYIGKNSKSVLTEDLSIETITSTDQGVAFIISYQDKLIYHAGDLNWWTWQGETAMEYSEMTTRFKNEMKKLVGKIFDVAFVPLDPRQKDRFWWGFHYFMNITDVKAVFPMHFWMDYSVIERLKSMEESKEYADKVYDIKEEGQSFYL